MKKFPDEDVLAFPPAWLRLLHPRRGGAAVPPPRGDHAGEVSNLLAAAASEIEVLQAGTAADPLVRQAARRHLEGRADPAGAAAVAAVAAREQVDGRRAFVDRWRADHGIGFAACALVELARLTVRSPAGGDAAHAFEVVRHGGAFSEEEPTATFRRVRSLLARASESEYDDAVRRLADHRTTPATRVLTAYLAPTRSDWVDECIHDDLENLGLRRLIRCSVGDVVQAAKWALRPHPTAFDRDELATMADAVGVDLLGFLLDCLDQPGVIGRDRGVVLDTVAVLPSDEAFGALVDLLGGRVGGRNGQKEVRAALLRAMKRFPVRALRLLAASSKPAARPFLRDHVTANPELVAAALPGLPDEIRAVVEPLTAPAAPDVPEAPADVLPALPWDRPVKPVVPGLEPPPARGIAWDDGMREAWLADAARKAPLPGDVDWKRAVRKHHADTAHRWEVMLHAPEAIARGLLATVERQPGFCDAVVARGVVARFGMTAFGAALAQADYHAGDYAGLLVPFRDADIASTMAGRLLREGPPADVARAWVDLHGLSAVPYLAPAALGTRTAPRRAAEAALRRIADRHGLDAVAGAVCEAPDELRAVLSAHPARTGLLRRPKIGGWLEVSALPPVLLHGRARVLPPAAVRTLLEMLALPGVPGTGVVEDLCDPESLAEFGLALFERWRAAGMPSDARWALAQLGRTGDDAAVRTLAPILRAWPKKEQPNIATGLRALAAIGTDRALAALYEMAFQGRSERLRNAAADVFGSAADERGLTVEQFADRLVPDFGLTADGTATFDYGPRRFTVGFDAHFRPIVTDQDGARRRTLPKPTGKDDPRLAPAAHARYADLRTNAEAEALLQIARLETAMVECRCWTSGEFRDYAVEHPIVRLLARRLVWFAEDGPGSTAFRIAEDGTFADVADEVFEPPESARIRVAHPALLGAATQTWAETFADYEILQPFEQLGRRCLLLTERELDGPELDRLAGLRLLNPDVHALPSRGWTSDQRGVTVQGVSRRISDGRHITVEFEPGPDVATLRVRRVRAAAASIGDPADTPLRFRDLDPARTSEALTQLTDLAVASP